MCRFLQCRKVIYVMGYIQQYQLAYMQVKDSRIFKEITSNPQRMTFARKGSTEADDLNSVILVNPTFEKMCFLKDKCPNLEYLKITKVSQAQVIEPIGHMKNVIKIYVSILSHIKEDALRLAALHFKQLKELSIEIDGGLLDEKELLELVKALSNLQKFQLRYNKISDKVVRSVVENMPQLVGLYIPGANIGNEDLAAISRLKKLKELNLSENPQVTFEGIRAFTSAKVSIQILQLSQNYILNRGVMCIARYLLNIRVLHLDGCNLSNAGVIYLGKMKHIKEVRVDWNKFTDAVGYKLVRNLRKAQMINLSDNYLLSKKFARNARLRSRLSDKVIL